LNQHKSGKTNNRKTLSKMNSNVLSSNVLSTKNISFKKNLIEHLSEDVVVYSILPYFNMVEHCQNRVLSKSFQIFWQNFISKKRINVPSDGIKTIQKAIDVGRYLNTHHHPQVSRGVLSFSPPRENKHRKSVYTFEPRNVWLRHLHLLRHIRIF